LIAPRACASEDQRIGKTSSKNHAFLGLLYSRFIISETRSACRKTEGGDLKIENVQFNSKGMK
jgi:hypothetical protein